MKWHRNPEIATNYEKHATENGHTGVLISVILLVKLMITVESYVRQNKVFIKVISLLNVSSLIKRSSGQI